MFQQNITQGPGTGTFTSHTFEILIMLLGAFLLGLWLGWALWARYKEMADQLRLENMSNLATAETLRNDLTTARNRIIILETDGTNYNTQITSLNRNNTNMRDHIAELESELKAASTHIRQLETELGLSFEPDVTIPEELLLEITPMMEETPYVPEAQTPESVVEPVVVEAMPVIPEIMPLPLETKTTEITVTIPEMTINVPVTERILIQPEPIGTVDVIQLVDQSTPPLVAIVTADGHDDLTVIEGIGPKIQMLLNQYGIHTYRELADTDVARMKDILAAAGPQLAMHDPGTWPSQANLAANDQWEALKSIQGFLKGGKKPV